MDIAQILKTAENSLGHLEPIKDGLYKGQINIVDKPAGTFFIDFNEDISLETFSSYQENLLSDEYYNLSKDQQWNLYLFLLRDHIDDHFKAEVEKDDRYARKYVFNEEEFVDFFTINRHATGVKTTLIEDWKHSLEAAEIGDLYTDCGIQSIVDKLNSVTKATGLKTKKKISPVQKIKYVRRIKLNSNFRPHPVEPRLFDFKRVNLIKGINGVGKTSLFEAIEIAICGATFRNNSVKEDDGCVEVMYDYSKSHEICKPSDLNLYKSRELAWYNVQPGRSHQLHFSFNRFNYFNADAAQRFASGSSDEDIRKALINIILGPEYEYIKERTEKLIKEVRPTFNKLDNEKSLLETKRNEAEAFLKSYKEDQSIFDLSTQIDEAVKNLNPVRKIPPIKSELLAVEQFIKDIKLLIEEFTKENITSEHQLIQRVQTQAAEEKRVAEFRSTMDDLQKKIKEIQEKLKECQYRKDLLLGTHAYFTNPVLFDIIGSRERSRIAETNANRIVQLTNSLNGIQLDRYRSPLKIDLAIEQRLTNTEKIKGELLTLEKELRTELEKLGKIQGIIQQIKSLGKAYLDSDESFHDCPLCETGFSREQLQTIVQNYQAEDISKSSGLNNKNDTIRQLNSTLNSIAVEIGELRRIKLAFSIAFPEQDIETLSLHELIDDIIERQDMLDTLQQTVTTAKVLLDAAQKAGISEENFIDLQKKLTLVYPEAPLVQNNQSLFSQQESEIAKQIITLEEQLNLEMENRASVGVQIKSEFDLPANEPLTLTRLDDLIVARRNKLVALSGFMDNLKTLIKVDKVLFTEKEHSLSSIQTSIETYKGGLNMQADRLRMNEQLNQSEKELKDGKGKYERYKFAYETLNGIKEEAGDEQINVFFDQHLSEITDVFKSIHAPHEFKDIKIDSEGEIILYTTNNEPRRITQISTGQRSALVISIFLTLNKSLKHGPDIIMFDDPVSFIDDLNSLSFLDYLRLFILKDKQVFFATANNKLASLFEKKFSFLGEEGFAKWELKRDK